MSRPARCDGTGSDDGDVAGPRGDDRQRGRAVPSGRARRGVLGPYLELTKARLSCLVLLTTVVGFTLGSEATAGTFDVVAFVGTILGTALAAGAANALNQVLEMPRDRLMPRTQRRPLPAGEISPRRAVILALMMSVCGVGVLAALSGPAPAGLALLTILIYVLLYTPMKVRSTLNTLVGAVCGAIPPMIGWAGATGSLGDGAWLLGGLLFVWQIPHFLALAWLYREDYARASFRMLPVLDPAGRLTGRIVVLTSLMLVPLALTATLIGLAGWVYAVGSVALGLGLTFLGLRLHRRCTAENARRVFLGSLAYLTVILVLLLADRGQVHPTAAIHRLAVRSVDLPATADLIAP